MKNGKPWRYDDENGWIVDSEDKIVAFCSAARTAYCMEAAREDFELIVTAVNAYDSLVAALETALTTYSALERNADLRRPSSWFIFELENAKKIRAALAKVKP